MRSASLLANSPLKAGPNGLHSLKESRGHLCPGPDKGKEPLGENFSSAILIAAEELADKEMKDHLATSARHITQRPLLLAMDLR